MEPVGLASTTISTGYYAQKSPRSVGWVERESVMVYEYTSHPSNIQNLTC